MKPAHLVHTRPATIIGGRPAPLTSAATQRIARGTREQLAPSPTGALVEHQLGMGWMCSLRCETLGRNIAVAAGMEFQYRLGRAHSDFEAARFGRRKRSE